MFNQEPQKENILFRHFSQTLGLFILLLITLWGARFVTRVVEDLDEISINFVEVVDPLRGHN